MKQISIARSIYIVIGAIALGATCGLISSCNDKNNSPMTIAPVVAPINSSPVEDEFEKAKERFLKAQNELRAGLQNSCKTKTDHAYSSEEEYRKMFFSMMDFKSTAEKATIAAAAAGKDKLDIIDIFNKDWSIVETSLSKVDLLDKQIQELKSLAVPKQPIYDGTFHLIGNVTGSFKELDGIVVRVDDNYYVIKEASSDSGMTHGYVKPTGKIVILNVGSGRPAQVVTLTDDIEYRQDQSSYAKKMTEYAKQVREYPQIKNKIDHLSLQRQKSFSNFEQAFQIWICSIK